MAASGEDPNTRNSNVLANHPVAPDGKDVSNMSPEDVRGLSPAALARVAWLIREQHAKLAGPRVEAAYRASKPPTSDADPAVLAADLGRLVAEIQSLRESRRHLEAARNRALMLVSSISAAVLILGLGGEFLYEAARNQDPEVPVLHMVWWLGLVGGLVSVVIRVNAIRFDDPVLALEQFSVVRRAIVLRPLLGAIFAMLLYLILIAGIVKGSVFPDLHVPVGKPDGDRNFTLFIEKTGPYTGTDFAKLFLWAFLAGFAERLVPGFLNRITRSADVSARMIGEEEQAES